MTESAREGLENMNREIQRREEFVLLSFPASNMVLTPFNILILLLGRMPGIPGLEISKAYFTSLTSTFLTTPSVVIASFTSTLASFFAFADTSASFSSSVEVDLC